MRGRRHSEERQLRVEGGSGPLLQRDYWAVIEKCRCSPSEVCDLLATRFCELCPVDLAAFHRAGGREGPLEVGEELDVAIRLAGTFGVRVVHKDAQSITLATLEGHPEVGRITFGAYRNDRGEVVFHIRSRARSSDRLHYSAFLLIGESMQANTWAKLVEAVALSVGSGVVGSIVEETRRLEQEPPDPVAAPTYVARGD